MRREHNGNAWLAWHVAFLSSFHPTKARDFVKLDRLQVRDQATIFKKRNWRDDFAKVQAWAGRIKDTFS